MKTLEKFCVDISEKSYHYLFTPGIYAKKLPFYIESIGHYYAYAGYYTERAHFKNYLLLYTVSGNGFIKVKDKEYQVTKNDCILLDREDYHLYKSDGGHWELYWMLFDGSSVKEYFDQICECDFRVQDGHESRIHNELKKVVPYKENNDLIQSALMCNIMSNILTEMLILAKSAAISKDIAHKSQVSTAIAYIEKNYNKNLNINDILSDVYISKYYFLRLFKQSTGVSVYEYLINYRIAASKNLLKDSKYCIYEIAEQVGFNNVNNFIQTFKRITGVTPNQYRLYMM